MHPNDAGCIVHQPSNFSTNQIILSREKTPATFPITAISKKSSVNFNNRKKPFKGVFFQWCLTQKQRPTYITYVTSIYVSYHSLDRQPTFTFQGQLWTLLLVQVTLRKHCWKEENRAAACQRDGMFVFDNWSNQVCVVCVYLYMYIKKNIYTIIGGGKGRIMLLW